MKIFRIKNKKGTSFIEIIIAVFIFSLLMTVVSMIFLSIFSGYKNAKVIQADLENAQYAINLMSKSLRTSSIVSCDGNSSCSPNSSYSGVRIYDYSQRKCISYVFRNNTIEHSSASAPANSVDPKTWCLNYSLPSYNKLISNNNTRGLFYATQSVSGSGVGRITISTEICATTNCSGSEKDKVRIQSTVSLRDYGEIGL